MPVKPIRTCLFCAKPLSGIRAREHVFPQWLLDYLDIRDEPIQPTQQRPSGELVSQRSHLLDDLQEGRVCCDCNSGWMSKLEGNAKPILIALIEGHREVSDLGLDERPIVARWAAKTAYMLNSASNYTYKIPSEHVSELFLNEAPVPKTVSVFGTTHTSDSPFYWMQCAIWAGVTGNEVLNIEEKVIFERSYKVVLQFRKLMLVIACFPFEGWRLAVHRRFHIPLWPLRGPIAHYETVNQELSTSSKEAVITFSYLLMVAKPE